MVQTNTLQLTIKQIKFIVVVKDLATSKKILTTYAISLHSNIPISFTEKQILLTSLISWFDSRQLIFFSYQMVQNVQEQTQQ